MRVSWNRRAFLKIVGLAAGSTAMGFTAWSCKDEAIRETDSEGPGAPLTRVDLDRLVAFAAVLFEPENDVERRELDSTIRWWSTGRTTRGPHLELYRAGLAGLSSGAGTSVDSTSEGPVKALEGEILEGIYSTAIGWKSLGYPTWPGVPSGKLEYTTRPPRARVAAAGSHPAPLA